MTIVYANVQIHRLQQFELQKSIKLSLGKWRRWKSRKLFHFSLLLLIERVSSGITIISFIISVSWLRNLPPQDLKSAQGL